MHQMKEVSTVLVSVGLGPAQLKLVLFLIVGWCTWQLVITIRILLVVVTYVSNMELYVNHINISAEA